MSGPMNGPEGELRNVLQSILMGVCTRCDFVHGEALRPSGNACLVQVHGFPRVLYFPTSLRKLLLNRVEPAIAPAPERQIFIGQV